MTAEQALYVWVLFHVGAALQILLQARASIAAKSNSIESFRVWWEYNHRELGLRLFIDGALWMGWMVGPHFLGEAAAHLADGLDGTMALDWAVKPEELVRRVKENSTIIA